MDAKDTPRDYPGRVGDIEAIDRLRRWGGDALVTRMVGLFQSEAPQRVARIRSGIANERAGEVESAAHSLKSSCAQIGALHMRDISARLEQSASEGDLAAASEMTDRLEHELVRFSAWLRGTGVSKMD